MKAKLSGKNIVTITKLQMQFDLTNRLSKLFKQEHNVDNNTQSDVSFGMDI